MDGSTYKSVYKMCTNFAHFIYKNKSFARSSRPFFYFCTFLSRYCQICNANDQFSSFTENVNTRRRIIAFRRESENNIFVQDDEACLTSASSDEATNFCTFYVQKQKLCTLFTSLFLISVYFFVVIGKSATWNDQFSSFTEKVNTQRWIIAFRHESEICIFVKNV